MSFELAIIGVPADQRLVAAELLASKGVQVTIFSANTAATLGLFSSPASLVPTSVANISPLFEESPASAPNKGKDEAHVEPKKYSAVASASANLPSPVVKKQAKTQARKAGPIGEYLNKHPNRCLMVKMGGWDFPSSQDDQRDLHGALRSFIREKTSGLWGLFLRRYERSGWCASIAFNDTESASVFEQKFQGQTFFYDNVGFYLHIEPYEPKE